ncbi:MAG: hypothetical protein A2940_00475 [Candidatus Wildermuthbacteria bacterium RIFCSPLOWO2_01_FULL_48_29]|uniref:Dockerin domain-containing protein n=1 Tax=Candidatus Wildermuthbacteria bacterium RIFCSPLOWO2_01_FULL_48_29 TaxID=1802462 RepID=A0A1G2RMN0_9BACT|nr:MAG: hypothetical protein A2940_00475 [Candidatus Wildermuthbacteria bacterium RIFCSPLOWO2_01_FULL_48_29]
MAKLRMKIIVILTIPFFLGGIAALVFFVASLQDSAQAAVPSWNNLTTIYYNPAQDDPANKFIEQAANELKANLGQAGKTLTVVTTPAATPAITLTVDAALPELAGRNDEAFKLFSDANGIYITGKTPIATRHGAYALLEKLGFRYFFRHPMWKIIPSALTSLDGLNEINEPAFLYRRIWSSLQDMPNTQSYWDWQKWNKLGGAGIYDAYHNYDTIVKPVNVGTNPEWFTYSSATGGSAKQLNVENQQVIDTAKQFAINKLSAITPIRSSASDLVPLNSIPVSPNDGPGWEYTYDKATGTYVPFYNTTNYQLITDKVFGLANEAAKTVSAALSPNKYVGVYSYAAYSCVPTINLEPNLLVQIANGFNYCDQPYKERIENTAKKGATIGIRDYYDVWKWHADNPPGLKGYAEIIPYYAKNNVKVINAESGDGLGARGLLYYVMSKLYWEPNKDPQVIMNDFYEKAFSPAKGPIKKYYDMWYLDATVTDNKLGLSFKYLNEAEQLAVGDAQVLDRIRFLEYYMRYLWKWRQRNSMTLDQLKVFYTEMSKTYTWSVVWFKYIQPEFTNTLGGLLLGKGLTRAELDALSDRTLPTPAQAKAWLDEGLAAFPDPIDAPPMSVNAKELAPLSATMTVDSGIYPTLPSVTVGGDQSIFIAAKAGETVAVDIPSGGGRYGDTGTKAQFGYAWRDSDGNILEEAAQTLSPPFQIKLAVPKTDVYLLDIDIVGENYLNFITLNTSHPASFRLRSHFTYNRALYTFVPPNTPGLIVGMRAGGGAIPASLKVYDPAGSLIINKSYSADFVDENGVRNPTSGIWKIEYTSRLSYGADLWILGIPPFLWHDPKNLLIPAAGSSTVPTPTPATSTVPTPTPSNLPLPSLSSLDRLVLYLDKSSQPLQFTGSNFASGTSYRVKITQEGTEKTAIDLQRQDDTILTATITSTHIGSLPPGLYSIALLRLSDSYTSTFSKQLLITKLGDIWSSSATAASEIKGDGRIDINDVSRLFSKWNSVRAEDLAEADINPGPANISLNKIDIYDVNKMMANWSPTTNP